MMCFHQGPVSLSACLYSGFRTGRINTEMLRDTLVIVSILCAVFMNNSDLFVLNVQNSGPSASNHTK